MASSYTSLLGLVLPVTGELSGNWGDVWNDSGTSLIDSAIAGTTTLSTDGDVTLTTTTGASNQARQAILLCSGARTALRTITAPAQSKIYTVINATTGGFSVKIVGVGPTTGVTIVAGESAVVAWNGSDFIKISNTGGSASFTNVTVSGTTTLSGLTASTALALDASKNVVSVTNTGTGNNVLSASPTLTGTLAAAAATFSGDVTLGDASTDTVTVNGYMGVGGAGSSAFGVTVGSTALTGVSQAGFYSAVTGNSSATTGVYAFSSLPRTAASAFTSTTVAGFYAFNASKGAGSTITNQHGLYIADQTQGTNNFGITSAVSSGSNKFNIYASGTADNYFAGNVGIGTTAFANSTLRVSTTDGTYPLGVSGTTKGLRIVTSATDVRLDAVDNTLAASYEPLYLNGSIVKFGTSLTERMRLDSTGLGIGTSSPTNALSVTGSANITGNTTLGDATTDTVTVNGYMGVGGAANTIAGVSITSTALTTSDQIGLISDPTGNSAATTRITSVWARAKTAASAFTVADLYAIRAIDSVKGAGSTITNQHGLAIADQTNGTNNYGITSLVSSGTNKWNIYASGTAANYFAGSVGIGTNTPANQLVVSSASNAIIQAVSTSNTTGGRFYATNSDGDIFDFRMNGRSAATNPQTAAISTSSNSVPLQFNVSGVEIMRMTNVGLGIGTTPGTPLDASSATNQIVGRFTHTNAAQTSRIYTICGAATGIIQQYGESHATNANELRIASPGVLALQTAGTLRATLDSSGNLGLGVTPSAWGALKAVQLPAGAIAGFAGGTNNNQFSFLNNAYFDGTNYDYIVTDTAQMYRTIGGTHQWHNAPSGTAGTAITFSERMRLSAAGGLSIGTTTDPGAGGLITTGNTTLGDATTDTVTVNGYMAVGGAGGSAAGLWVRNTALTGTNQNGILVSPVGTTSGTSVAAIVTNPGTAASVYTATALYGMYVGDAVKGAGSTITTQNGITIADQTQGVSNIGLTSQVSSGSGKWNIYVTGTADNYFAGRVGFGTTALGGGSGQYRFSGSITGATTSSGLLYTPTIQSDATANAYVFHSQPSTAAAAFTITNLVHYHATQATIGAGSTVTNQFGFNVQSTLTGATNNYGFYGGIASGTGRWNLYMAGTADNYFAGNLGIGTSSPAVKLDVVGAGVFKLDGSGSTTPLILRNNNTASTQLVKLGFDSSGTIKASINAAVYGNDYMTFNVGSDTERARIDSSGNLLVGTTSSGALSGSGLVLGGNGIIRQGIVSPLTVFTYFYYAGTQVGSISTTGAATAYNTSSDYRLKNITGPITTSGAYIDSLNPVEGTWKADGSTFVGLIAHEVQEASRTTVATGVKDGEEMQGMDYSSAELIANLIAEVKALRTRVAALESI